MSPSTPGGAALSVPVNPPQDTEAPVPVPVPVLEQGDQQVYVQAQAQAQAQTQTGLLSASAPARVTDPRSHHAPGGVKLPTSGEQARAGVLSTPATPVPSVERYVTSDPNDKWPRGPASASASVAAPVVPKWSNGPSLLTQQLAEARGRPLPVTGQAVEPPHLSPRLQHLSCDPSAGSHPRQDVSDQGSSTKTPKPPIDPQAYDDDDGDTLTPRASPRATAMAATAVVSTFSLPPRALDSRLSRTVDMSEIGDATPRLGNHRDLLRSSGRGMSLERTDTDSRLNGPALTTRTYSDTSAPPGAPATMTSDWNAVQSEGKPDAGSATEPRSPTRPGKPEHRLSMGPEKAWSIGSEDLNNAQDGQVEKAIAEVLAGVEPNARSRKASHSLRFFKEGLPEEKLKRRDSRLGPKDKLSAMDDVFYDEATRGDDLPKSLQPSPHLASEIPGRLKRTRTLPLAPTAETQHEVEEPPDYFLIRPRDQKHTESPTEFAEGSRTPRSPEIKSSAVPKRDADGQDGSSDAAVEDGDMSGEEKISSAVFVPHKGLQGVSENSDESEADVNAPAKTPPRTDHGSSWLVKADEPEADEPGTPDAQAEQQAVAASDQNFEIGHFVNGGEQQKDGRPAKSASIEQDSVGQAQSKLPQVVSPGYGDHVHDHQLGASQPLDAIELVPYRHQVGGHTTLWRFSKRAVCKQLNNRENEFYEQIEKHHRDLLPFLPRYVPLFLLFRRIQSLRPSR